jgi:hypothetical protein
MATPTQNSPLGAFAQPMSESTPYQGEIVFKKKTISFYNTVLLRQNITQIEKYGVKRIHRVSDPLLIFSAIMFLVGFSSMPYTLILSLLFGFVIYLGIKERNRPKLSGLTIELSSGATHTFLSPDRKGIDDHFSTLSKSLEDGDIFAIDFRGSKFTVNNITGDRNIVGHNNIASDTIIN